MRDATLSAIVFVLAQHAHVGFETDPRRLADLWGIRFILGSEARATNGPPSIVTLPWYQYTPGQRFTAHHEIAHILVQRSGMEEAIRAEVSEDVAEAHLEAVVNHIAALLVMPQPLVVGVTRAFGETPQAVLNVAERARVSLPAALYRWVSHDPHAERAAFMTSGNYISHIATCNTRLPFWRYDCVPEPEHWVPDLRLVRIPAKQHSRIGVLT